MKQGRQALGGWRRQEVAKTWRRWRSDFGISGHYAAAL